MSYIPQLTVALCPDKKTYIGIENADIEKTYYCPCCGEEVYPKALNSKFVKMHFCHKNNSCNNENIKHFIKKWEFVNRKIIEELDLQYDNAKIEEEHITEYGKYIPDVTLYLSNGTQVFLEIKNTNKKSSDYILKWDYLGCDVIEYDINKDSYYYLYKNNELCQKLKMTRKEKSYIELLEHIKKKLYYERTI